ncbi:MAG: hypothetical protein QF450_09845 [Rhodospirillales bacterium]|jgi:hypothetical protein|nr:hypothetical protein [Rhodospirillales bacterium]HJO71962.1 hypothetical protein [Rhodospirillales bacterium]
MSCRIRRARAIAVTLAVILAVAAGPWWVPAAAGEAGGFLSGIEDLPLMPHLNENTDGGMVFDTPAGRIVEAFASGAVTRAQVLAFYAATLPQLGWTMEEAARYSREGEILRLEFTENHPMPKSAAALTVHFALSPDLTGGNRR